MQPFHALVLLWVAVAGYIVFLMVKQFPAARKRKSHHSKDKLADIQFDPETAWQDPALCEKVVVTPKPKSRSKKQPVSLPPHEPLKTPRKVKFNNEDFVVGDPAKVSPIQTAVKAPRTRVPRKVLTKPKETYSSFESGKQAANWTVPKEFIETPPVKKSTKSKSKPALVTIPTTIEASAPKIEKPKRIRKPTSTKRPPRKSTTKEE